MKELLRLIAPELRLITPGWKIRRFIRRGFRTVLEGLALVGVAVLLAALWVAYFL